MGLPFLPIWIAPFLLLSPLLLTGRAMFWGTPSLQFVPWRALSWDLIRSGELPLWNSLVGMGAPLLANYQSALFYPPNWSLFLLDAMGGVGWAAWGQALLVSLHLAWAGTGMAFLARRLGLGILAQTICGLAFGLSGYLVARSGFLSINAALAWLPWVLLFVLEIILANHLKQRRPIRYVLILSLILSMQFLAGHAQTTWYTLLLAVVWAGFWSFQIARSQTHFDGSVNNDQLRPNSAKRSGTSILRPWMWLALVLFIAGALSSVQLLPTGEYLLHSQRAVDVDYEYAMAYSYWPWRFITLFAPDMFGSPVTGDYWGYGNYWEDDLYLGLLPFIFALAAIIHSMRLSRSQNKLTKSVNRVRTEVHYTSISITQSPITYRALTYMLVVIVFISFVLALGINTPIFPWLYHNVPTFALFQAPTRFTIWAEVCLVLLAGLGMAIWHRPEGRALYWTRLATAGGFAISVGSGLTWLLLGEISPTFIRASMIAGFLGVGIGILTLTAPVLKPTEDIHKITTGQQTWMVSVIIFVMLDLLIAGWGLIPGVEKDFYANPSPNAEQVRSQLNGQRLYMVAQDEYKLKFERFMRFDTFDPGEGWHNLRAAMIPNLFILDGIPSVNNFDPLVPDRYAQWMEYLGTLLQQEKSEKATTILNLMGVGLVEFMDQNKTYGVAFDTLEGGTRIRWVPCAYSVQTGEEAWDQVIKGENDFEVLVVLEAYSSPINSECINRVSASQIFNISNTANRMKLRVTGDSPGWLVISDVWYPGWHAYVDGVAVSIYRANYLFRAVPLSAGSHEVEFVYRPLTFWLGFGISMLAWSALVIFWLVFRRRHGK
jgi:hypothetical protein